MTQPLRSNTDAILETLPPIAEKALDLPSPFSDAVTNYMRSHPQCGNIYDAAEILGLQFTPAHRVPSLFRKAKLASEAAEKSLAVANAEVDRQLGLKKELDSMNDRRDQAVEEMARAKEVLAATRANIAETVTALEGWPTIERLSANGWIMQMVHSIQDNKFLAEFFEGWIERAKPTLPKLDKDIAAFRAKNDL